MDKNFHIGLVFSVLALFFSFWPSFSRIGPVCHPYDAG